MSQMEGVRADITALQDAVQVLTDALRQTNARLEAAEARATAIKLSQPVGSVAPNAKPAETPSKAHEVAALQGKLSKKP